MPGVGKRSNTHLYDGGGPITSSAALSCSACLLLEELGEIYACCVFECMRNAMWRAYHNKDWRICCVDRSELRSALCFLWHQTPNSGSSVYWPAGGSRDHGKNVCGTDPGDPFSFDYRGRTQRWKRREGGKKKEKKKKPNHSKQIKTSPNVANVNLCQ